MSLKSFIRQKAGSVAEKTTSAVSKTAGAVTSTISNVAGKTADVTEKTVAGIGMKLARKAIMNDKKVEQANAAVAAL